MKQIRSDINFTQFFDMQITEINRMYPILIFDSGHLMIECTWRLRRNNTIIVGRPETEIENRMEKAFELFEQALIRNTIKDIIHYEDISDLTIVFNDDIYLDIFHDSSLYEGWQLSGKEGFLLVSVPGGNYVLWPDHNN